MGVNKNKGIVSTSKILLPISTDLEYFIENTSSSPIHMHFLALLSAQASRVYVTG